MKKISSHTLKIFTHEHIYTCHHHWCFSCLSPLPCPPSSLPNSFLSSDNPVLYSYLIFYSVVFSSHSSDSSSQHLNQICHWVIVSSLLCGNNREYRVLRAKGIDISPSPSYIKFPVLQEQHYSMRVTLQIYYLECKLKHHHSVKSQNVCCGSSSHLARCVWVLRPVHCTLAPGAHSVLSQRALSSLSAQHTRCCASKWLLTLLSCGDSACGSVTHLLHISPSLLWR